MSFTITWLGHSGFSFDIAGSMILIDPLVTDNPLLPNPASSLKPELILMSHADGEHLKDVIDIAKRTNAPVITNYEAGKWPAENDLPNLTAIRPGEVFNNNFMDVAWVASDNGLMQASNKPNGFIIATDAHKVYYAGKTRYFDGMAEIGELGVDVAMLPIGGDGTMNTDESLRAIQTINPRVVIPTHHSTFPKMMVDVADWANRVNNDTAATPVVLDPGGVYHLS